jgi:hypothetical protein
MSISALPKDVLHFLCVKFLSPFDIARLGLVSKEFARLLLSDVSEPLWQRIAELEKFLQEKGKTWRQTVILNLTVFANFDHVARHIDPSSLIGRLKGLLKRKKRVVKVAVLGLAKTGKSAFMDVRIATFFVLFVSNQVAIETFSRRSFCRVGTKTLRNRVQGCLLSND